MTAPKRTLTIKRETVFEYLFVILLIFECCSIFTHTVHRPKWLSYAIVVLFVIAIAGCMLKIKSTKDQLWAVAWKIILIWVYLGIFVLIMPYNVLGVVRIGIILSIFVIFYSLYCKNNGFNIMLKYRNVIFLLAAISLFFWFFGFVLGWLKPNTAVVSTWTGEDTIQEMFFYLSGSTQKASMFGLTGLPRNTSIFTEAPMSSLHFSLAYIFEEFKNPNGKRYIKLVLFVAVLSTFSTTGYIILVIALIIKFMRAISNSNITTNLKGIVVGVLIVVGCIVLCYLLIGKLGTGSGSSRLRDFTVGFKTWAERPFFGYGYRYEGISGTGYSNSITPILLSGGIYVIIPYIYTYVKGIVRTIQYKDWSGLVFIGLFLTMFVITIIPFQYLTFFVMMYIASEPQNTNEDFLDGRKE